MKFIGGTSNVQFTVVDRLGHGRTTTVTRRRSRIRGRPLFVAQLIAIDRSGAETINITVAGENSPGLVQGQSVRPEGLEAIHWVRDNSTPTVSRVVAHDHRAVLCPR